MFLMEIHIIGLQHIQDLDTGLTIYCPQGGYFWGKILKIDDNRKTLLNTLNEAEDRYFILFGTNKVDIGEVLKRLPMERWIKKKLVSIMITW